MKKYICLFILFLTGSVVFADDTMPVELVYFQGIQADSIVLLSWGTATEINNYGFEIYRSLSDAGPWEKIGFVEGHGTIYSPNEYAFTDTTLIAGGKYFYRLLQMDTDGNTKHSQVISVNYILTSVEDFPETSLPDEFTVFQNYPNPFNPSTTIAFRINSHSANVSIVIYDICGRELFTAVNSEYSSGDYTVSLNMQGYSAGNYFFRTKISASDKVFWNVKSMTLLK